MHRHGYKGRKFGRETDQRRALLRSLAISLIEHGRIETTLPKAKDLRPMVEKLITKAKKGTLATRRQVIAATNIETAYLLVDQIAPQLVNRDSGYLRIEHTEERVGDNTQMAIIEFVDKINYERKDNKEVAKPKVVKPKAEVKTPEKAEEKK